MQSAPQNVVRLPVSARSGSQRHRIESVILRFPRATSLALRLFQRLPATSRFRQRALQHFIRQAIESLNRGDFEVVFCIWHDHAEFLPFVGAEALGLQGTRGRAERIQFQRRWVDEWGQFRFEPREIIDLGDSRRLMWVGGTRGSGLSSGAAFERECAVLLTIADGWVVREEVYFDHAQAFAAAGLSAPR